MREDYDLAFLLRYENVAWYEDGVVRILDRRVYPLKTQFVFCSTYQEVARCIADMVTQSYGPYQAAAMGMVLAAHQARGQNAEGILDVLTQAAYTLSHARPTTSRKMELITGACMECAKTALQNGENVVDALLNHAVDSLNQKYARIEKIGTCLANKLPHGATILTQCYAETDVGMLLRACKKQNNPVKVICAETRPYLQGARLTASIAQDMGFDTTVISDNMPGYVMKKKHVDVFTSAADIITMDGHVINKIGTFQMALCAWYHGIPYYVTGNPDRAHPDLENVTIEERDPELVLHAWDQKVTMPGVKGYYPAFDITPPHLCSGVVTDKGIFAAGNLPAYYEN